MLHMYSRWGGGFLLKRDENVGYGNRIRGWKVEIGSLKVFNDFFFTLFNDDHDSMI